jgi:hypothetical protein
MILGSIDGIIKVVGAKMPGVDTRPAGHHYADIGEFLLGNKISGQGGTENRPLDGFGINTFDYGTETGEQGLKKIFRVGCNLDLANKLSAVQKNDVSMGTAYIESNDHAVTLRVSLLFRQRSAAPHVRMIGLRLISQFLSQEPLLKNDHHNIITKQPIVDQGLFTKPLSKNNMAKGNARNGS